MLVGAWLGACSAVEPGGDGFGSGDAGMESGDTATVSESSPGSTEPQSSGTTDPAVDETGAASGEDAKFDVGGTMDLTPTDSCGCGNDDWSYIWVANAPQSTVSKIDTRTLQEEGRYLTRPDGMGNPSRTSVSIDGRAVAVANRHGGVVKIWARPEDCTGPTTSTGSDDVLAWGEDDCVAWYVPFDAGSQRPIAWTAPELDPDTCEYGDQKLWTVTCPPGGSPGFCGAPGVTAHRMDGESGVIEDSIDVAGLVSAVGAYGGAVDQAGNFWFHAWGGNLVRIDYQTLEVELFDVPGNGAGYGITVDTKGRVWFNWFVRRFDYATLTWDEVGLYGGQGGLAEDQQGRMWIGGGATTWVDIDTLEMGEVPADLPGGAKGVAVDIDGQVWVTRLGDPRAYRIDPETYEVADYEGLTGPYTYSDMTGGQLTNVACTRPAG